MLKLQELWRSRARWVGLALLAAALLLAADIDVRSSAYQACAQEHQSERSKSQKEGAATLSVSVVMDCTGAFIRTEHDSIIALFTVILGFFTGTLWWATKGLISHAKEIERAYVSGGGAPTPDRAHFILTAQNYGKTPGTIQEYAVVVCDYPPPRKPAYLARGFRRVRWLAYLPPNGPTLRVTAEKMPSCRNPIAYGRFWYTDVWGAGHVFSFILPAGVGDDHSLVANVDPEYIRCT